MHVIRHISPSITWVGGSDRRLSRFENIFPIPRGVSYNSYLISDQKTALLDTADASILQCFLENVYAALGDRPLDYLILNHMEPDHCAGIVALLERFPSLQLVGNAKTLTLFSQFYDLPLDGRTITVQDEQTLSLGSHTLQFFFTPMVHWPEVMMTYEQSEKVLFSADAFGSFGALGGTLFADEVDFARDWLPDYRRYYANIVGKYGVQVQNALKKLAAVDVQTICPLHGLVWRKDLNILLEKYDLWSRYQPEEKAVAIFYGSMYGDTENAADLLACALADAGVHNLAVHDLSEIHVSEAISEIFRCSHIVLAAPTYNNGIYPPMLTLLHDMKALNVQNRTVALIENGSWAPTCAKNMRALVDELKNMSVLEQTVTIRSAVKDATRTDLLALAQAIAQSVQG